MPKEISKVGKYEVVKRLAKGGMGAVYLAKHPTLKRFVILKRLTFRGGREVVERFKREASLMMDFRSDHIVQVYDHFKEGNSYYIVMEYVDGINLDSLIKNREKISTNAAILIFHEICKGLKYAHDKGVIHRDIKPANILISKDGQVKIVDFGIATTDKTEDETLTRTGAIMGTPSYMSPEQISDSSKVYKESDIYSIGVVFYEMLTGIKPFPSTYNGETITKISKGKYKNPKKLNPDIPTICKRIIKKTMNPKINKRYHDLQQVIYKLSKRFHIPKDQKLINEEIKKYLDGSEIGLKSNLSFKKSLISFKTLFVVIILLIAIFGAYYFFKNGYQYEYFKSKSFGLLKISAVIPKNYYKPIDRIFALGTVSKIGKIKISDKQKGIYRFYLHPSKKFKILDIVKKNRKNPKQNNKSLTLNSGKIYLPAGEYNLELYIDNQKFFSSFRLFSRKFQKSSSTLKKGKTIEFSLGKLPKRKITIKHNIYDAYTGKPIYNITDIRFFLPDKKIWIDWKKYNANKKLKKILQENTLSGKTYFFKYSAPHYVSKTVRFYSENSIDMINIDVYLEKISGK